MKAFKLPKKFLLGVATASLQIEGGDTNNSWYRWCRQKGRIADGSTCDVADDHWNRVDEDIALMRALNLQTCRLSLEWSRIEPQPGKFDPAAMDHYRDEVEKLRAAGIRPLITLHHFSNPLWLEDHGAWLNPGVVARFAKYASHVCACLGDLVNDWVTINEPNVYLAFGYLYGIWPPGRINPADYFKGARNMIAAHVAAYRSIHTLAERRGWRGTRVGAAYHFRIFEPGSGAWAERLVCRLVERYFHAIFTCGMAEGRLLWPLGQGKPFGCGTFQDFWGINYYSRDMVCLQPRKFRKGGLFQVNTDGPRNDLGWELYPRGLYELCRRYFRRLPQPIFILENGTCDRLDAFRARFIYDHLLEVKRLVDDGVDVQRYYHWTLMDNFEWAEGLRARFGLVAVDYATQKRTVRASGRFYGEICRHGGISAAMIANYLTDNGQSHQ